MSTEDSIKIQEVVINSNRSRGKIKWVNISDASKSEIEFLRKKYNFELRHLQASSGKIFAQRPAIESGSDYLFMILHFPILNNNEIICGEIDFFLGHGYLVTLHNNNFGELTRFFNLFKKGTDDYLLKKYESSSILLYELLEKLMLQCYSLLDQNSIAISGVEKLIFTSEQRVAVSQILGLKRNIINLRKIMQNHKNILKQLTEMKSAIVPPKELKKYYSELVEHSKRIWETLENQKEMIDALHETNESMLNYKISDIMKTLTIFSVIVLPLTLMSGIFGMNTTHGMPFMNNENGFEMIIALMMVVGLGMLLIFEKKKWL